MNTSRRIGLWFVSLLVSVTLFSFISNMFFSGPGFFCLATVLFVFRVTMIFALPVWCLYLPFVIVLKDAEERRIWTILVSGTLIGPAALVLWGVILQIGGGDPNEIWHGDPLAFDMVWTMIFALIVGFLTSSFYVIALKMLHHRSAAAKSRFS